MKDWNIAIGNRISELLAMKNWKQADLIATGCVKKGHLSHVINGSVGISLPSLIDICNALDISLSDFFKPLSGDSDFSSNAGFSRPAYLNPILAACYNLSEKDAPLARMFLERLNEPVSDSQQSEFHKTEYGIVDTTNVEDLDEEDDEEPKYYLPLLGGAAAGSPIYRPADDGDLVEVPEKYADPDRYAVFQARGDSMEPRIPDGAFVVVSVNELPQEGEVGVIMLSSFADAEYVVKRFYRQRGKVILRSYNQEYTDMTININDLRSAYRMVAILV